jgi:uncharacterized protein
MTGNSLISKTPRIEVIDALRGFAVMSIMFLHNIEHFDLYYFPDYLPEWLKSLDGIIWKSLFFLFSGKAYAIFALLFGFTFFIQFNNQEKKGLDFRGRFLWRLFLLLILGLFNSIFYAGDILTFYALIGVTILVVCKWSNKAVFITAIILMVQPLEWAKFFYILFNPDYILPARLSDMYYGKAFSYLTGQSFLELVKGNLWNGKMASFYWSWENGRLFQTSSLFMLGMLLGRKQLFVYSVPGNGFWKKVMIFSIVFFIPLFILKNSLSLLVSGEALVGRLNIIFSSWSNFAFMAILVSLFVLLYQNKNIYRTLAKLAPFGRMSLSNYLMQSVVGSFIYYGYGLAFYKYTGATISLMMGIFLFLAQLSFCHWWLKRHNQGPFEYLWHRATWIKYNNIN